MSPRANWARSFAATAATLLLIAAIGFGCAAKLDSSGPRVLRLAVTTSTRDSGLLDVLLPVFERQEHVRVDVIAVGTGKALKLAETGDVDAVLVHARQAELALVAAGHAVRREEVMYNTFEILGPPDDPAGICDMDPVEALQQIAARKARFVSRGDDSGTHKRELQLWQTGGGRPAWQGYIESGQGMGATLIMADQMRAYVLSDRGTFLRFRSKIELVPLNAPSDAMKNVYGALVVNPAVHPGVHERLAQALVDFIISPPAQRMIRDFRIDGQQLFVPLRLDRGS